MAIIGNHSAPKKEKLKVELNADLLIQINEYCAWAGIDELSYFIEEAAHFVFSKDKEWKKYKKMTKHAVNAE